MTIDIHNINSEEELKAYYDENELSSTTNKIEHLKKRMSITGMNFCGDPQEEKYLRALENILFSKLYPMPIELPV